MKNENVQKLVSAIESALKEAKVTESYQTYATLTIGEENEEVRLVYNSQCKGILVSMGGFGKCCDSGTIDMVLEKILAYEDENEELTSLRWQKEDIERRIAELEKQ